MNVTHHVVTDLLPLYLAGEASDDTRALLEAYLQQNPTFAAEVREQAEKSTALLGALTAVPSADHEKATLQRVRQFNRRRANLPGVMISPTCWDPSLPSFGKAAENVVGSAMISNFRRR